MLLSRSVVLSGEDSQPDRPAPARPISKLLPRVVDGRFSVSPPGAGGRGSHARQAPWLKRQALRQAPGGSESLGRPPDAA
jgi:hypothetical protein